MKNILALLTFLIFLYNCSGLEFVYKTNKNDFIIKDVTSISVSGEESSKVYILLRDKIGDNKKDFPKYRLDAHSTKKEAASVVKKDATASKFNIQYKIKYELYNLYKNCKTFIKEISTVSSYSSESAGYSFGTDLSEAESNEQTINKNIEEFILSLNLETALSRCIE